MEIATGRDYFVEHIYLRGCLNLTQVARGIQMRESQTILVINVLCWLQNREVTVILYPSHRENIDIPLSLFWKIHNTGLGWTTVVPHHDNVTK